LRKQHLGDVAAVVRIGLIESKPARHAEELVKRDVVARIVASLPLRQQRPVAKSKLAVRNALSHQRIEGSLAQRPTQKRHGGIEARRIALSHDAALIDDHQRTCMAGMGRIRLGEGRVHRRFERGAVHTFRKRLKIDAFPFWPKRMEVGRRSCGEQICGLIAKLALALADNVRAAKAFSENGDLPADTEGRGRDKPPLAVNARLKEPQQLVASTTQILGKYGVGVTFRDKYIPA
jgi:hypothetical protein